MRIALLGIDDTTLALAEAAAGNGHDAIVMVDATAARVQEAKAIAPAAQFVADWETVLDSSLIDAAVVAADEPAGEGPTGETTTGERGNLRIEQLRRLIQVGIPMLVSHPVSLSMLECYELEMIREETHSIVLPYLPTRWHPAVEKLRTFVDAGASSQLGPVEQVVMQRYLAQRDRESVLRQFAIDADLLQFIAGTANKLHALGSAAGGSAGSYANLTVQMTCGRELVCRWAVSPVEDQAGAEITLIGAHGKAVLWMPAIARAADSAMPWRLEVRGRGDFARVAAVGAARESEIEEYNRWNPAATALEKLAAARDGEAVEPTWAEASRTVELAETIDRSLARGRTIELHEEEFSDIGTFKGTMTSIGCGLLVAGLALVVVVALVHLLAVQAGWNQLAAKLDNWPYLLLAMLGIYLVLQPLVFIGGTRQRKEALRSEHVGRGERQAE